MPAYIPSSDLKTILHSKRANLYYLEHCRILVNGGRVEYVIEQGKGSLYQNIPIASTTCILLGAGMSVTQAAMHELSKAGVVIEFYGGGGTPLFAGCEIEFSSPQSEYRPTEYLQRWCGFWFDDAKRLTAAKHLQAAHLKTVAQIWPQTDWRPDSGILNGLLRRYEKEFQTVPDNQSLLAAGGRSTAKPYSIVSRATLNDVTFKRSTRGKSDDAANKLLDHGNYLVYGLGATTCWVLGLPHGLAVLHGRTRRGGLIFDAADTVKDALILPQVSISAAEGDNECESYQHCIERLVHFEALDIIIDTLKSVTAESSK